MFVFIFRARPTTRDCFTQAWLQDSYLMKLRRQTLTFTSGRLKEFLVEQQCRRTEGATKHKVLLRTYQSSPQSPASGTAPHVPSPKWHHGGNSREFKERNAVHLNSCMKNVRLRSEAQVDKQLQRKEKSPRVTLGDWWDSDMKQKQTKRNFS